MLNVREEPKACVFYPVTPLPRISLDIFGGWWWCSLGKK
jgi:hypothetical protein